MVTMAKRLSVFVSRIPKAKLTSALIHFLKFLHKLPVSSGGLCEEIFTSLPSNTVFLFTNKAFYSVFVSQK
jgi:hypothetical protein